MKTSWGIDYVERVAGGAAGAAQWRRDKCKEFERSTGVRWGCWQAHGKFVFAATWDGQAALEDYGVRAAIVCALPADQRGITFTKLAEITGRPLKQIVAVSLWMSRNGWAAGITGRNGGAIGLKRSRQHGG